MFERLVIRLLLLLVRQVRSQALDSRDYRLLNEAYEFVGQQDSDETLQA